MSIPSGHNEDHLFDSDDAPLGLTSRESFEEAPLGLESQIQSPPEEIVHENGLHITQELPEEELPDRRRPYSVVSDARDRLLDRLQIPSRHVGVIMSSFQLNPHTDEIIQKSIDADPLGQHGTIFDYLPDTFLRRSSVLRNVPQLARDPRLMWSTPAEIYTILTVLSQYGFPQYPVSTQTKYDLLAHESLVGMMGEDSRYAPYLALTSLPRGETPQNTNRLLSLKSFFFWSDEKVDGEHTPRVFHRLIQAFSYAEDPEDLFAILFPDLDYRHFFTSGAKVPPVYFTAIQRLQQMQDFLEEDEQRFLRQFVQACLRMPPESFGRKTLNTDKGGASMFDLLQAEAQRLYESYRNRPFDFELLYQREEARQWQGLHLRQSVATLPEDSRQLGSQMRHWGAYRREVLLQFMKGFLGTVLQRRPDTSTLTLQESGSLKALFDLYSQIRQQRLVLPAVDPETGKPFLQVYVDQEFEKRRNFT